MTKKTSVLFVCLGNICRSPTAEAVFRHKALEAGLDIDIDSVGTHGYHIGSPPDKRSRATGEQRGYSFDGLKCRRLDDEDFVKFDYILAMDSSNYDNLLKLCEDDEAKHKIRYFLDFAQGDEKEVPDPYYGGKQGFELVLDLIEKASDGLIKHLQSQST
ncbi:low molecular weight protein-tyrosine-phosphatase [Alteromonas sp. C1M14]|uniref:low molecular weight protein-tyrosine-phosphatase n=1 Tax=Alteromonas sp. C1M14 TaxID=2841567 RepID=UPI001C0A3DDF|nr:low molecular weight protein-tyrosine-phosphatase [Alteromonas sp. C1M14]MBU2977454.1 low molecular weight phosphotyrosine protein phosphatase [Alteromonas sp. C1M14]